MKLLDLMAKFDILRIEGYTNPKGRHQNKPNKKHGHKMA